MCLWTCDSALEWRLELVLRWLSLILRRRNLVLRRLSLVLRWVTDLLRLHRDLNWSATLLLCLTIVVDYLK